VLPDDLWTLRLTAAQARDAGLSRRELQKEWWSQPFRGVNTWRVGEPTTRDRILDAAAVLPSGAAVGGWAAALLHGADDLSPRLQDGSAAPVLLCMRRVVQVRRDGVLPFRSDLGPEDIVEVGGVPVTSPLRTAFDLARLSPPREAVVALDALARSPVGLDVDGLVEYVRARPRWRGVPQARWAVGLHHPGARSCPETEFRLIWTIDAGLPPPLVNQPVFAARTGALLGIADLLDEEGALAGEYDGALHRVLEHHAADNEREERFESHGILVVRATVYDLAPRRRGPLVRRILALRSRGLHRDRGLDRWALG
jgi:hypothetical protein